jgi:lysophospholipase L1-like esterase
MGRRWLAWASAAALAAAVALLVRHESAAPVLLGRYSPAFALLLCGALAAIAGLVALAVRGGRAVERVFSREALALALGCAAALAVGEALARRATRDRFARYPPGLVTWSRSREYDVEFAINADGFRDRDRARSAPGRARVAVLGDSFTWGSGVPFDSLYTTRLEAILRAEGRADVDVLNFGIAGSGPFQYLKVFRGAARAYAPRIVIVPFYAGNDVSDALAARGEAARLRSALAALAIEAVNRWAPRRGGGRRAGAGAGRAATPRPAARGWDPFGGENPAELDNLLGTGHARGVAADTIRARFAAIPDSIAADALALRANPFNLAGAVLDPDAFRKNLLLEGPQMMEGWRLARSALGELARAVERSGARMILVAVPPAAQVDARYQTYPALLGFRFDARMLAESPVQDSLAQFAASRGIAFVDLLPDFRAARAETLYYLEDGHWNARGHDLAARRVAAAVRAALESGGRAERSPTG